MKHYWKKALAYVLALMMLLPFGANVAYAASPIIIEIGSVKVVEGGEVAEVEVTVKNNPNLQFSTIALQYDKSVLELQKDTAEQALTEAMSIGADMLGIMMGDRTNDLSRTLRFKVLDPTKVGVYEIKVVDKDGDNQTILSTLAGGQIDHRDPTKVTITEGKVEIPKAPVTEVKEVKVTEKIPFATKNENDATLDRGTTKVKQEGVDGETTIVYEVTTVDGTETKRVEKSRSVTKNAVDKIVLVGTKDVIEVKEETRNEVIPFGKITKNTDTLEVGKTAIETKGVDGERTVVEKVTYTNGEKTKIELVSATVTKEKVDEVTLVGTKAPADKTPPVISKLYQTNVVLGELVEVKITVDDKDATVTVNGLPEGVTFDSTKNVISGKPVKEGTFRVVVKATDPSKNSSEQVFNIVVSKKTIVPPVTPGDTDPKTETPVAKKTSTRISGITRFTTAVEISKASYKSADTVLIADGYNYPDALAATVFSHVKKAPILLGSTNSIPKETLDEIARLGAKNVILIGGTSSISDEAAEALGAYSVMRIAGADRYETADKIAAQVVEITGNKSTVVVAQGNNFPDALTVSALAIKEKAPLLLTRPGALSEGTKKVLDDIDPSKIYIAGGTTSVSSEVESALGKVGSVERMGGKDRYATAALIAGVAYPNAKNAIIASGVGYIDAMVAGPLTAVHEGPILPVLKDSVPASITEYLAGEGKEIMNFYVIGGENTITENVVKALTK